MQPDSATAIGRWSTPVHNEAPTQTICGVPMRALAAAALLLAWSCARAAAPATAPEVVTDAPRLVEASDAARAALAPAGFERAVDDLGLEFTHAGGVAERVPTVPGIVLFDANNDTRLDLYLTDGSPSAALGTGSRPTGRFYLMEHERFVERTVDAGLALAIPAGQARGARAVDYDGDGDWDLLVSFPDQDRLMRNEGGRFTDAAAEARIARGILDASDAAMEDGTTALEAPRGRARSSESLPTLTRAAFDANLDGHPDLLTLDGALVPDAVRTGASTGEPRSPRLFLGTGVQGEYVDASDLSGPVFDTPIAGRSLALGDLDGDLDVDVIVMEYGGAAQVWLNQNPSGHQPLRLVLLSKPPNTYALGAEVSVLIAADGVPRRTRLDGRYLAQNEHTLTFGLGPTTRADVTVRWPDGRTTEHRNLSLGPTHVLH